LIKKDCLTTLRKQHGAGSNLWDFILHHQEEEECWDFLLIDDDARNSFEEQNWTGMLWRLTKSSMSGHHCIGGQVCFQLLQTDKNKQKKHWGTPLMLQSNNGTSTFLLLVSGSEAKEAGRHRRR
jgi:hypothetical protein